MMPSLETFSRLPFFAGLDTSTRKALAVSAEIVAVREGESLFHEEDEANFIYVILEGAIDLRMDMNHNGDHVDLERLIDGDLVGCSALVEPRRYALGAVAAKDTRLVKLGTDDLLDLTEDNPEAGCWIMEQVAAGFRRRLTGLQLRFVSMIDLPVTNGRPGR